MKLITSLYSTVTSYVSTLNRDTKGASAIEYAIIAGLIAVAIIIAAGALGGSIDEIFGTIDGQINSISATSESGVE